MIKFIMASQISQATLIPIGLALTIFGGTAGWVTKTELTIKAMAEERHEDRERAKKICETLKNIDKRLNIIESKLPRR
jgi:hypothetical protein